MNSFILFIFNSSKKSINEIINTFFSSFLSKIFFVNYLNHNGALRRFLRGGPIKKRRFTMEISI